MFFLSSPSSTLTIFPSFRIIVLLPYSSACFMLCVIMSVVIWFSFTILSVISMTEAAVFGSSAAVCSSSRRSFGVTIVDISSVSACRCPPLSNPTVVEMRSSRPSPSSFSFSIKKLRSPFYIARLSVVLLPRLYASPRFSSMVMCGAVPFRGS